MWRKAILVEELKRSYCFRHRRKEIAIFKVGDNIYATDNSCSHEYSPLSEGIVYDGHVYCPKHGSRFDIQTGEVKGPPATQPIRVFPVKVEDGILYVDC